MEEEKRSDQKGRARGRPRKEKSNDSQEDRRERAREAQKNYQLRKQADNESLKERVAFLENVIENMSNEFINLGDRIVSSRAQTQVLNDLKITTQRILEIARAIELKEGALPSPPVAIEGVERSSRSGSITPMQLDQLFPSYFEGVPGPTVSSTANFQDMAVVPASRWSPRIGYGLMGALPDWDPTPETLWTHYSVAGANSFAMRIYSDAVKFLLMLIRGQVVMPGILPNMGRYRFRHEDPRLLVMHLEDHLINIRAIEKVESPPSDELVLHGPADVAMTTSLRRAIFKDVRKEMGSIEDWVDPFHAQQYLVDRWQVQLTSDSAQISTRTLRDFNIPIPTIQTASQSEKFYTSTQDALIWGDVELSFGKSQSHLQPPEQDFNLVVNAQPLAQSLVSESICFGEGPRFSKGNIDKAVILFLLGISSAAGVLAIPSVVF